MKSTIFCFLFALVLATGCYAIELEDDKSGAIVIDRFGDKIQQGQIQDPRIQDISGIGISAWHPDIAYVHNGKDHDTKLFAVHIKSGKTMATFDILNATNNDWEDLAYGPCYDDCLASPCSSMFVPSRYCIYIGDFGAQPSQIYAFREPTELQDSTLVWTGLLKFNWPETNTKTLMISPEGNLYVVAAVTPGTSIMAEIPLNAWKDPTTVFPLDMSQATTFHLQPGHLDPTGGDISPEGTAIVFAGDADVYYYDASPPNADYLHTVSSSAGIVSSYQPVHKSSSIAWGVAGLGFYTTYKGANPYISYYPFKSGMAPIVG